MSVYDDSLFIAMFPEFGALDGSGNRIYPAALCQAYFDMGAAWIRDGSIFLVDNNQAARNYLTAHLLTIGKKTAVGKQGGFQTASSIDKISVTMLAPPVTDQFAFWLNGTPYGTALAAMLEVSAVGGLALGGLPEREGFRKFGGTFC